MKIKMKIALAIILTAIISTTIAYGAFLISHQITTSMVIKPTVSMGVFGTDGITELNHIDLGQWTYGASKNFPGGVSGIPTEFYYINNTDQMSFYVSFHFEGLPDGSGRGFWIKRGDQADFSSIGDGTIYSLPIESALINPDPQTQYAIWYFGISITSPPFGTYNPLLTVNAYDSQTG